MKKQNLIYLIAIVIIIAVSGCCTTKTTRYKTQIWVPVYVNLEEVRSGYAVEGPRELKNPGKIYVFDNFLFINEKGEGIHIIDNVNPSSPKFLSFIKIPGNGDMAVTKAILYADSYVDLLAIDIKDPRNPQLVNRVKNLFPNPIQDDGQFVSEDGKIITEYIVKDTVIEYTWSECEDNNPIWYYDGREISLDGNGGPKDSSPQGPGSSGKGGSMARFTLAMNYLYIVDNTSLQVVDLSDARNPKPWAKVNIGWQIETIYPYRDKLFIGSMTGMYVYDNSTPWNPSYLCEFRHARACDPVVANDKYAYVTLRTGTRCAGGNNQLDILDISDIRSPKLIRSYPMQEPYGLGIDGTKLFVCDGKAGLKVFDAQKPENIELTDWESGFNTYDIIPLGEYAIVIGSDGLYQFDYKDPKNLTLLSKIIVKK